jgi:6-phosphogluconolactonase (cycloisomerase 2 family)
MVWLTDAHTCSGDGRWVYATNRGHDSLAVFPFDAKATPPLGPCRTFSSGGSLPWTFDANWTEARLS